MTTKHTTGLAKQKYIPDEIGALRVKVAELTDEVMTLRAKVFSLRDEIHSMRNSRFLGKIIKARELVGSPYTLVYRSLNRVRRTLAKFIPDGIRLPLMKNLRRTRDSAKRRMRNYRQKTIIVSEFHNKKWSDENKLVTVVIPHYNRADTIDDTLDSLLAQTYKRFDVIIIDDGSSDEESIKKLKAIEAGGYQAKFVYQKNQGVAAARNNGIKISKGKYVVCLDSDDILEPTYLEKAIVILETNPDISIVTSYMSVFGVVNEQFEHVAFDPMRLFKDNMIITAAMFTKQAWRSVGGYKSNIGYEDWEFWINMSEHGFWAKQIEEPLFRYRTSMQSRYVEDKDIHWNNLKSIRSLHPNYKNRIKKLLHDRHVNRTVIDKATAFINLGNEVSIPPSSNANILITIPWMTFGGAETLIYNFCREIKSDYNITFITGLKSKNEWEYKFREISNHIYHLPNLFETETLYLDYISHQIEKKSIDTLHIIHNGFTFNMLKTLKSRHPKLRVILTLFNDRAAYFEQSLDFESYIDVYTSDNKSVIDHFKRELVSSNNLKVIPNGINCDDDFNPDLHDRKEMRKELGLADDDIAVFYVGRLSEEKNPNVFLDTAQAIITDNAISKDIKFFMIGDGGMKKSVEEQIDSIDSDRIVYLGYQSAIAHYLSAADIFVLPSSIEGFPLSVLEAMAMNVVVIASDVGAVAQVVKNGTDGYVITPGSANEIRTAIKTLSNDRFLLKKMKIASRIKVEKLYSNTILGKNYRNLYGEKR
jgi:glycosyltransferase involved in cell wall biosynthesis